MADNRKEQEGNFVSFKLLVLILTVISVFYVATVLGLVFGLSGPTIVKILNDQHTSDVVSQSTGTAFEVTTSVEAVDDSGKHGYRLPQSLVPFRYVLSISLDSDPRTEPSDFDGKVEVQFNCVEATNVIVLQCKDIKIYAVDVFNEVKASIQRNIDYSFNNFNEYLIIQLESYLQEHRNYSVLISYKGLILETDVGVYKSSYTDNNGEQVWAIGSQMQPVDARKVFPCFDEPALKAKFKITVKHHQDFTEVISNMPIMAKKDMTDGFVETEFSETVLMSTYLVAIVVSDFKCKSAVANAGLTGKLDVRVCARPNAFDQLDFALKTAVATVEYFEKYTGFKYPLPKLDHVALPYFNGGMENWGLTLYDENEILYDPDKVPLTRQNSISTLITHETAHNWFGNLVTLNWWDAIWLNEAITSYMEYVGLNGVNKNLMIFEQFVEAVIKALDSDSKIDSSPIVYRHYERSEIEASFNDHDITYIKGSAIVRMMNYIVSNETFTSALPKYLQKYKYSSVTEDDFFNCLQNQVDRDRKVKVNVAEVMKPWLYNTGYPVVTVHVKSNVIELTQKRFQKYSAKFSSNGSERWYVPFSFSRERINVENLNTSKANMSNLYSRIIWMTPQESQKIIALNEPLDKNSFILANLDFSGYYRVNYDDNNWNMIIKQLRTNYEAIPIKNRAQLIDDSFNFVKAEMLKINKSLELVSYMANETEYLPWMAAIRHFKYILNMLEDSDIYAEFSTYLVKLVTNVYKEVKWDEATYEIWTDKLLRKQLLPFACKIGVKDCVDRSIRLFSEWMKNKQRNPIKPFYQSFVYCTAIRYGSSSEWTFALEQSHSTEDMNQKQLLTSALTCTQQPWLIKKFVDYLLNKTIELDDSKPDIMELLGFSEHANTVIFNHLKEHYSYKSLDESAWLLYHLLHHFKYEYQPREFLQFLNKNKTEGGYTTNSENENEKAELTIQIKQNIRWLRRNLREIREWLDYS